MKVLYVKNNNQRSKVYQVRTIIYEINGKRFVKKEAQNKDAINHLKQIKSNYEQLNKSIINPKVLLSEIIDETEDSLTFEYIDGISASTAFDSAIQEGSESRDKFLESYRTFLLNSFETSIFQNSLKGNVFKRVFGDTNLAILDSKQCFSQVSNIDLIFSNIIYKNDITYIIDYEWVYSCPVPIDYVMYRAINYQFENKSGDFLNSIRDSYFLMEKHFMETIVHDETSFIKISSQYRKNSLHMMHIFKKEKYLFLLKQLICNLEKFLNFKIK